MSLRQSDSDRRALRDLLLAARRRFVAGPAFAAAAEALAAHLTEVLEHLDPDCLGLYWPMRGEFNAALQASEDPITLGAPRAFVPDFVRDFDCALPDASREPVAMQFRRWSGAPPTRRDGCGMPTSDGEVVVPDVLLVPCLGFDDAAFRLGYGGGYYDRYLAAHPHVTAVGVAWEAGRLAAGQFVPEPHDVPLMLVVTERGVVG